MILISFYSKNECVEFLMLRTAYYQLRELKGAWCSFCLTVYERKKTNNDNVNYIDKNN